MSAVEVENRGQPPGNYGLGPLAPEDKRRLGRLGAVLFLAGVAFSIPASLALQPAPDPERYALIVVGMLIGVGALLMPWERLSPVWLHVLAFVGILQIALAVALFSDDFAFYYVTVAAYAAYVVRDRRVLAVYFVVITIALLAPLVHDQENTREQAHHILVTLPVFLITAGLVIYLREVMERKEQSYRGFALEAVALAIRIRGSGRRSTRAETDELDVRLDELAAQAEEEIETGGPSAS